MRQVEKPLWIQTVNLIRRKLVEPFDIKLGRQIRNNLDLELRVQLWYQLKEAMKE